MIAVVVMIVTMIPSMAFATETTYEDCAVINNQVVEDIFEAVKNNADSGEELVVEIYGKVTFKKSAGMQNAGKVKFVGKTEDATIDLNYNGYGDNHTSSGAELTFEDLIIDKTANPNSYNGFHHVAKETFVNCTIKGEYWVYGPVTSFTDCEFFQEGNSYNVWTYGGKNVTFERCTFNAAGKAALVYREAMTEKHNVVFKDCEFNTTKAGFTWDGNHCAAIEIDSSLCPYEVTVEDCIAEVAEDAFSGIYRVKNHADNYKVNFVCTHKRTNVQNMATASCTVEGYTGDTVCTDCKEIVKKGDVIPATGHAYTDNVCTVCKDEVKVVTPVVEKEATEITTKEVETVVEAIVAGKETDAVDEKTAEAIKNVPQGNEIVTEVVAEVVTEEEVKKEAAADVKAIDETVGEDGEVAQYLDLSVVIKSIAPDGEVNTLGTLNKLSKPIPITLVIPEDLQVAGRTFYVIRVHDGEVDKLPLTKNADGSYTFTTDRFSTYALAYEDGAPNTGDNSAVMTYAVLAVAAMAVVVVLKRRNLFAK